MDQAPVTIVSGLPRSGTSLMMQMLVAGGIPPLLDATRPADESNPRGYLEFDPVKRLRTDRSWLSQARGRCLKVIHLLLPELPDTEIYRVIFMRRPVAEVIASQRTMLRREGRSGAAISDEQLGRLFTGQLDQVDQWLARQAHFSVLNVAYHDVVTAPDDTAGNVHRFLGGKELNVHAMTAAVDPALWRQRGGT